MKKYFRREDPYELMVPYNRAHIALLLGLRVETVIRHLKKLEKMQHIMLKESKIYV